MTNTQLQVGRSTGRSSRRRWGVAAGSLLVMVGVAGGVTPAQAADSEAITLAKASHLVKKVTERQ